MTSLMAPVRKNPKMSPYAYRNNTAIQRAEILCRTPIRTSSRVALDVEAVPPRAAVTAVSAAIGLARSDSGGLLGVNGVKVAIMIVSFRLLGVRTLGIGA